MGAFLALSDGSSGEQLLATGTPPTPGRPDFDPNLLGKLPRAVLASLENWREQSSKLTSNYGNHPKFKRPKQQFKISKTLLLFFLFLSEKHTLTCKSRRATLV